MAKRPTNEQLATAIAWLDSAEGDGSPGDDRSACIAVAIYLEGLLENREAREAGISVSYLRHLRAESASS